MKRSETGMVAPFEKFAWNNDKSKPTIRLPLKAIENPLLLYIEFGENTERFYLGEEKAVRQISENPESLSKFKSSVLMISEKRPLGSLLMDSHDFVTNHLSEVTNIFRSMLHSIDSGNSEKASDYKMLEKLWNEGNTFQRIIINYLFCRFYQVKHLAANGTAGIFAYTAERRREMYSDLEQSMEQELDLLAHNPTTLSDLKQLSYNKRADLTNKFFVRSSQSSLCSTYLTCPIGIYSLGYAQDVENRFSPTLHGGDTTKNVLPYKTRTTSSIVSALLNRTPSPNYVKRSDTDTITSDGVRCSRAQVRNCRGSTSRSLRNSSESLPSRTRT